MSDKISLKQAESKVFRTTFQDGLWDVFIGCIVLQFAIAPLLSPSLGDFWSSVLFLPFWALVFVVILLIKRHVVTPRIGLVKFGSSRKRTLTKFTVVMLAINVVAFILGIHFALNIRVAPSLMFPATFGFIVLAISTIAAYFLDFTRLFIYGVLFVLSLTVGEWLFVSFKVPNHGFPITFGATASIIILTGMVLFFRLLRNNPIPRNELASKEKT